MPNRKYTFVTLSKDSKTKSMFEIQFNEKNVLIKNKIDGRYTIGTLLDGPRSTGYYLQKIDFSGNIDPNSVLRYYKIDHSLDNKNLMCLGGRFIVYKNGTCELTSYGSGRPITSTDYGVLQ